MSSIEFINVKKSFGPVEVIPSFSLKIEDGDFVSFLGPSGCGKTTCLRMISGLENNNGGILKIDDEKVSDFENNFFLPPEKRHVGMVFQSYAVWPHMNVYENVAYPLKVQGLGTKEVEDRVEDVLKMVEMEHLKQRMPKQLSGGQQQRVALARGLVMQPRALLLDEPLSNLDAKLREKMRGDIRELQQKLKITCVYVTHDQIEAFSMSDKIVIMDKGEKIQEGAPQDIRSNPCNDFVADFIK